MKLNDCINCPHHLSLADDKVNCKFNPGQIAEKTLVESNSPRDTWIMDCPRVPPRV